MTETEFLQELRKALENDLDEQGVRENVQYYREYIEAEKRKGISEEKILEELGDPWAIARNITNAPGGYQSGSYQSTGYQSSGYQDPYPDNGTGYWPGDEDDDDDEELSEETEKELRRIERKIRFGFWLFFIFLILIIVGIISAVAGLIRFVAPVLVPLLAALLIVRIWESRR